ncbi:MAG: hypothetical protein AAF721_40950 [Myxococcota bacterium]
MRLLRLGGALAALVATACFTDPSQVDTAGGDDTGTTAATSATTGGAGPGDATAARPDSSDGTLGGGNGASSSQPGTTVALDGTTGSSGETGGTTRATGDGDSTSSSTGDTGPGEESTTGPPPQPDCCDYFNQVACDSQAPQCAFVNNGEDMFCQSTCVAMDAAMCVAAPFCFSVNEDICVPGIGGPKDCGQGR